MPRATSPPMTSRVPSLQGRQGGRQGGRWVQGEQGGDAGQESLQRLPPLLLLLPEALLLLLLPEALLLLPTLRPALLPACTVLPPPCPHLPVQPPPLPLLRHHLGALEWEEKEQGQNRLLRSSLLTTGRPPGHVRR